MKIRIYIFQLLGIILFASVVSAQDVIVIDGLGGARGRFMQGEVDRLKSQGKDVVYRPWFRWRSAARKAPDAKRVIGYSMGGPRAIRAANQVGASEVELVDPFSLRLMHAPEGAATTVFRASEPSKIRSTPVAGEYEELWFPTDHIGMAEQFPTFPRTFP